MSGSSDYDILDKENDIISLNDIVRVKLNKAIWQEKEIQIPISDSK